MNFESQNKDYVRVRLYGGLGNQLFQLSAGLNLSASRSVKLIVDSSWLGRDNPHNKSSFESYEFPPTVNAAMVKYQSRNLRNKRVINSLLNRSQISPRFTHIHTPKEVGYVDLHSLPRRVELRGYYQSYIYLDGINPDISPLNWKLSGDIAQREIEGSIGVHIRGGDYLLKKSGMQILSGAYYLRAIKQAKIYFPNLPLRIFTNDEEYAVKLLHEMRISEYTFFNDRYLDAAETLEALSKSKAIVGSNSTFAYWAALRAETGIPIIFPSDWFNNGGKPSMLYKPTWEVI
jgi:hypothetical protein